MGEQNKVIGKLDEKRVFFTATKEELEKRIVNFMEEKQRLNSESNEREFLGRSSAGCARTDLVSFKSHIKKQTNWNESGPLDRTNERNISKMSEWRKKGAVLNEGVEERVRNIEAFLQTPTTAPVPVDVYERIKVIENRLVEWEKHHAMLKQYEKVFGAYIPPQENKRRKSSSNDSYAASERNPTFLTGSPNIEKKLEKKGNETRGSTKNVAKNTLLHKAESVKQIGKRKAKERAKEVMLSHGEQEKEAEQEKEEEEWIEKKPKRRKKKKN